MENGIILASSVFEYLARNLPVRFGSPQKVWTKNDSSITVQQKVWIKNDSSITVQQKVWIKNDSLIMVQQKIWIKNDSLIMVQQKIWMKNERFLQIVRIYHEERSSCCLARTDALLSNVLILL
jgi:hypothetical protein